MGIEASRSSRFEISKQESNEIEKIIRNEFKSKFSSIHFAKEYDRKKAPDLFISPTGELFFTSNNEYTLSTFNVLDGSFPEEFQMRRSWGT